jgi:hypothetical protein
MTGLTTEGRQHEQRSNKSDWSMEHPEVKPRTQCGVLTVVPDSKSSIQLNFSCSSAVVPTAYTWMVVGQEAIEARGIV